MYTEEKPPIEDLVEELKHYGVAGMQKGVRKIDILTPNGQRATAAKAAQIASLKKKPVSSMKKKPLSKAQKARMKRIKLKLAALRAKQAGLKNGKPHTFTKKELATVAAGQKGRMAVAKNLYLPPGYSNRTAD